MKIKVGDVVKWRGGWGSEEAKLARITHLELCEKPRMKYGDQVEEVEVNLLKNCVVSLDNGHWAYGTQIEPV